MSGPAMLSSEAGGETATPLRSGIQAKGVVWPWLAEGRARKPRLWRGAHGPMPPSPAPLQASLTELNGPVWHAVGGKGAAADWGCAVAHEEGQFLHFKVSGATGWEPGGCRGRGRRHPLGDGCGAFCFASRGVSSRMGSRENCNPRPPTEEGLMSSTPGRDGLASMPSRHARWDRITGEGGRFEGEGLDGEAVGPARTLPKRSRPWETVGGAELPRPRPRGLDGQAGRVSRAGVVFIAPLHRPDVFSVVPSRVGGRSARIPRGSWVMGHPCLAFCLAAQWEPVRGLEARAGPENRGRARERMVSPSGRLPRLRSSAGLRGAGGLRVFADGLLNPC